MEKTTDIAIIGGGLASLAAALALEGSGKEITLVRKAPGAAALSNGAFDLGGNPFQNPKQGWREYSYTEENLRRILQRDPHHPLNIWCERWGFEKLFSFLENQITSLKDRLPLALGGDGDYPMALVSEMGKVPSVALAQASMSLGDLKGMERAKLLVVGIEGLASFRAPFIANSLNEAAPGFFSSVDAAEISLPFLKGNASLSPFEIAEFLDQEAGRKSFVNLIEQLLARNSATHVLLPPVIGMIHTGEILHGLEKSCGRTFAEVIAGLPSVPGWRLSEAVLRYFKLQEYNILPGEAVGFEGQNRRVKSLTLHYGPERMRLHAKQVILASGKFLAGGIQDRDGAMRESVFGLPLFLKGRYLGEWGRSDLFTASPGADQPAFSAGICVNQDGHVLGLQGEVLWENLFACGRVLSGTGVGSEGASSAVSLISGAVAGKKCRE